MAKTTEIRALGDETWGEKLHRAYRAQRAETGDTYEVIVERVSHIVPTHQTSVMRLETWRELPIQTRTRLLAYFTILAYGFNPEDFGLTKDNVPLAGYDMKKVSDLLKGTSACMSISAA